MGPFWTRLLACERKIERYRLLIRELTRQVRALQQQLADRRASG